MDFELKPLRKDAVPRALERAKHYRNLNEPSVAESICRDIVRADPDNAEANILLLLSLTDQFDDKMSGTLPRAKECLQSIEDSYLNAYYAGLVCERQAVAVMRTAGARARHAAYNWLRQAMEQFESAAELRPPENDDAILRWNMCARILNHNPHLSPTPEDEGEAMLE